MLKGSIAIIESAGATHASYVDLPYFYRTLGEAHSALGDKNEARKTYRRSLELVNRVLGSLNKKTGGVMEGDTYMDHAFTMARVKIALSDQRPVLHIASHFKFTPGTESDSYLLLGDGGRLSLRQIREDDLQFDHVDLLTLSACETAVGDNARGAEVEGLGAIAQKQGAKAVLATLWPVADKSTGIFMREMYRIRAEQKLTKSEAIR